MPLDPRAAAARAIAGVLSGQSLNQVLPAMLKKVGNRDRGLLQELCYGTLRHGPRLQALLLQLLDKPMRKKDNDVQALLMVGLYQLEYMRTPPHAAVAATVEATRLLRKNWATGMANAVLRRFQRERDELCSALETPAALSHPQWLYDRIGQQWPEHREAIIAANNQSPPMTLRSNSTRVNRDSYLKQLQDVDIEASPCRYSEQGVNLAQAQDVHDLPGFTDGDASVQDEAAQLAAGLLDTTPGERVLDACAAPGGKACHILELQPELAELVAMDVEEARLERVRENLSRLSLTAKVLCGDAAAPPDEIAGQGFDRILVDAPCSASGVIRRHPDVKYLRRPADLRGLATQQGEILAGLWPLLKEGGQLLYATCSIFREENDEVVQGFLEAHPDADVQVLPVDWGVATRHGRQLLPCEAGPDGLYYSRLVKACAANWLCTISRPQCLQSTRYFFKVQGNLAPVFTQELTEP